MQLPTTGNYDSPNSEPQWWRQSRRWGLFWLWKCLLNLSVTLWQWRKEGRLEIGPCSHKFPGMSSNFNSSHCSYFLFLWNILFACLYSHMQELLLSCRSPSLLSLKHKHKGFNVGEPPVNVEVKSSLDLGTAVLGVQCWTDWHTWLGASGAPRPWKILFLGTLRNWNYWRSWRRKEWTSPDRRKCEA